MVMCAHCGKLAEVIEKKSIINKGLYITQRCSLCKGKIAKYFFPEGSFNRETKTLEHI